MEKLIELSHIKADAGGSRLHDLCLDVYKGEIITVMGLYRSGKSALKGVLEGSCPFMGGSLYVAKRRYHSFAEKDARRNGIYSIDGNKRLVGSMTIAENLFLIRPHFPLGATLSERVIEQQAENYLQRVGLGDISAANIVRHLTPFQQQLVCIARAIVTGVKLLIVDCVAITYNQSETDMLKRILCDFRSQGISCLILTEKPIDLMNISDRACLIRNGRDFKVLTRLQMTGEEVISYLKTPSEKEVVRAPQDYCIKGIFDLYGRLELVFQNDVRQDLSMLKRYSCFEQYGDLNARYKAHELVLIPERSSDWLLWDMSLGDNLNILDRRKMSQYGIINRRVMEYRTEQFLERFELARDTRIRDLDYVHLKILAIARWELRKPTYIWLEEPGINIDILQNKLLRNYMEYLAELGIEVVIFSKNRFSLEQLCDEIYDI